MSSRVFSAFSASWIPLGVVALALCSAGCEKGEPPKPDIAELGSRGLRLTGKLRPRHPMKPSRTVDPQAPSGDPREPAPSAAPSPSAPSLASAQLSPTVAPSPSAAPQ